MNLRIERRCDFPELEPTDKYQFGVLHYFVDDKEVSERTYQDIFMSESSYYECCQNFGTHTAACVRESVKERRRRREWQHTCINRRDIPCAACDDEGEPRRASLMCWNVIEGEY